MRETGTNSNEPAVMREAPMCEDRTRNRPLNCELYHISTDHRIGRQIRTCPLAAQHRLRKQ